MLAVGFTHAFPVSAMPPLPPRTPDLSPPHFPRQCRHTQAVAGALAASPKLAAAAPNGPDAYLDFSTAKDDDESLMSDERTSSATGLSGHTGALALAAAPAADGPAADAFLALPPPVEAASATLLRASDDEFEPAMSGGADGPDPKHAPRSAGAPFKLADADSAGKSAASSATDYGAAGQQVQVATGAAPVAARPAGSVPTHPRATVPVPSQPQAGAAGISSKLSTAGPAPAAPPAADSVTAHPPAAGPQPAQPPAAAPTAAQASATNPASAQAAFTAPVSAQAPAASSFKLTDTNGSAPPAATASSGAASVTSAMPAEALRSTGNTTRLPMPALSMSRIPSTPQRPESSVDAAMEGTGSVPYPDAPSDGNLYMPSDGESPLGVSRIKLRPLHALSPPVGKPPLAPSSIPAMSEGASWSPPPAIATRSVHALPKPSPSAEPPSPTSSIGGISTYSRTGFSRSIHAQPRSGAGGFGGEDSMFLGGGPRSPSAYSVSASVTSSVRRRMRTSLHVLPKRGGIAASGPFGTRPEVDSFRASMDPPQETAPL